MTEPAASVAPTIDAFTGTGTGGGITVSWELHRATVDNVLVEDISDQLTGGEITLNHDRAIRTQATFQVRDVAAIEPPTDYLAVFLNRSYDDGRSSERDQLGLYTTTVPPGTRSMVRSDGRYAGQDLTAVLARYAFDDTYNIAAGTNVVTAVTTIIGLSDVSRWTIPATDVTLANAKSFDIGVTYLDACNQLLDSIGYYHLSMTPDGRLTSGPSRNVQYVEPYRTIGDADYMGEIDTQPTNTGIANIVIVVNDNMIDDPITATRTNTAVDSPTSVDAIGPRTRIEYRSDLADQDAVDALAARLLAEGRTWYQTASLTTLPDPRVLLPHQTVDLDLTGKAAILSGRWWVRTARMGLTADTSGPKLELNRVTDRIKGQII